MQVITISTSVAFFTNHLTKASNLSHDLKLVSKKQQNHKKQKNKINKTKTKQTKQNPKSK